MALSLLLLLGLSASGASAAFSAARPPMGWNPYNARGCDQTTQTVFDDIDDFNNLGFRAAGYSIFGLDCGWQATFRGKDGTIDYDRIPFPNGIFPLMNRAKSKGFLWGMYTDLGVYSCDTRNYLRLGSLGHEMKDAYKFSHWGVDYLKVDNCFVEPLSVSPHVPRTDFLSRFSAMANALNAYKINGMLTCQWGVPYDGQFGRQGPSEWTYGVSTSFRVSDDIDEGWDSIVRITNQAIHVNLNNRNGPNHWLDMDLLEVGNQGMTVTEQASHFAIWAMFKSALFVSTKLATITGQSKLILQNKGLIAINQDPAGKPVKLLQRYTDDNDQYSGPLANGDVAVLLVDRSNTIRNLGIGFAALGIQSATVTNLWTNQIVTNVNAYFAQVQPHGSVPLRLSNIVRAPSNPSLNWHEAEDGTLNGNAKRIPCSGCTGGAKVGDLGPGGSVTIRFQTSRATQDIRFDYVNCDVQFRGGNNARRATIVINSQAPFSVEFPISGYNWGNSVLKNFLVRAYGLGTGTGINQITVSGSGGGYAPDIDRIGVIA